MAGPSATTPEVLPYDAKAQAEWLHAFRAAARKDADKLSAQQRARLDPLDADLAWLQRVGRQRPGQGPHVPPCDVLGFRNLVG
jgi:hypothetical protein